MAPGVYFTSRLLPAQRFLWIGPAASNLLPDPSFTLDTVAADLERTRPGFIILERNNRDSLLGWRAEERFTVPAMQRVLGQYAQVAGIKASFSINGDEPAMNREKPRRMMPRGAIQARFRA